MVEEKSVTLAASDEATGLDPIVSFDLDTLVSGAVRLRADRIAIADSKHMGAAALSFAEFDRRVSALAALWLDLGLKPGERILIAGGATATCVIALIAALRAGLDVALAPLHLGGEDMRDFARGADAAALAAENAYGELHPAGDLLNVAAQVPRVRLVCSLGGGEKVDGAVDADPERLAPIAHRFAAKRTGDARIITRAHNGEIVVHRQQTLVAAALDLVTRARIGMRLTIVTTLAPVSFAGLVAGPVAALLAGAPLLLHGPFAAADFTALVAGAGPAHLVVPAAILPMLQGAGFLDAEMLASLILVSRRDRLDEPPAGQLLNDVPRDAGRHGAARALNPAARKLPPIVDLFAIGEHTSVPEERKGNRLPALAEPHYISLDDRRILAVGRGATFALEGAAVTDGAEPRTGSVR
jgi:non-ribosomal peptide synthetase component F